MTQPPMRKQNRLGALQVGVARHESLACKFSLFKQCRLQIFECRIQLQEWLQHPQAEIGGDLIVAAASRVEFACGHADQLCQAALDGGVNILVGGDEGKLSRSEFFL